MSETIITQKDEECSSCGAEMPKGSWARLDNFDRIFCEDCDNI